MTALLSINIGMDPNLGEIAGLVISWHGVFTAVGIIAGVWLAVRMAESARVNIDPDTAYWIGMLVVFCGIIGARALYVIENYGSTSSIDSVGDIFRITEGGISIYGAILGGAIGGWAYGLWKKLPAAAGADAAAFGMLLGLGLGRIGDLINGEHLSKATDLPWGVTYSNPNNNTGAFEHSIEFGPTHPTTTYEMLGDFVILGLLFLLWRFNPKAGVIFCVGFIGYAIMRFSVSFLRLDSEEPLLGLTTPQVVSVLVVLVLTPLLIYFLKRPRHESEPMTPAERARASISRAERRRRLRA